MLAVFALDVADGEVKGFLVPRSTAGIAITKIGGKTALRMVPSADIALDGVRVPDSARLGNVGSFADVARMLRRMRSDVAWIACGAQAGAYEAAVRYTTARSQFGRPVAGFQLVQEKLARMLANLTASLGLVVALTGQQERGVYRDEDSALAKMFTAAALRETAALVVGHLAGRLAKYKIPRRVVVVDRLPRTASGKIRKSDVERPGQR